MNRWKTDLIKEQSQVLFSEISEIKVAEFDGGESAT